MTNNLVVGRSKRRYLFPILLVVFLLTGASVLSYSYLRPAKAADGTQDILRAVNDLIARGDYQELTKFSTTPNSIIAVGSGKITDSTTQGKLLAKRAALTDARRNLLILKQDIQRNKGFAGKTQSASGYIGAHRVKSEHVDGNIYKLEVEMSLDEWWSSNFNVQ
ncbi:MAG: hypothetical protein LBQ58_10565 [Synergistaceae bacterium]|jgi:hypothetical protein|nr:hypothetical protein [Synergistaceae bacterium]